MPTLAQLGVTPVTNLSPMQGPDQITEHATKIAAEMGKTVPAPANLPAAGNWVNRSIMVESDKTIYVWDGSGWVAYAGPLVIGTVTARTNFGINAVTRLVRRNGIVTLNWYLSKTAGGNFANSDLAADIPTGFRPASNAYASALIYSGVTPNNTGGVIIQPGGALQLIVTGASGTDCVGSITYPHA